LGGYILRRLLLVIPTLFGVMIINFALTQFVPGGPIDQIRARQADKRGGEQVLLTLNTAIADLAPQGDEEVLRVHEDHRLPIERLRLPRHTGG